MRFPNERMAGSAIIEEADRRNMISGLVRAGRAD
jgi:hypothetical protein